VGSRLPRLHCRVTSQGDREQRTAVSCKAVHSINFDSQPDSSELATILGACTGLRTLVLNAAPEPRLLALNHLCRLEIVARGILSIDHNNQLDFPCVSHLELLASRERSSGISHLQLPKTYLPLRRFPQLTHLALSMLPVKPWPRGVTDGWGHPGDYMVKGGTFALQPERIWPNEFTWSGKSNFPARSRVASCS
jgi:hypothetical protein